MLQDIPKMSRDEVYRARYEIAGIIAQSREIVTYLEKDITTRAQGNALRLEIDTAEIALVSVTRPR